MSSVGITLKPKIMTTTDAQGNKTTFAVSYCNGILLFYVLKTFLDFNCEKGHIASLVCCLAGISNVS